MADRRLIAQSITNSGQVAQLVKKCGPWGAVLFTWVLTFIDDDSRFEGDPETLRHKVLGRYLDHVDSALIAEIVATMNDIDLAVWYEVVDSPGERYLYFPRFTVHQTLREDRYGPSRLPAPPGWRPEEGHPYAKNAARQAAWKPGQPAPFDLRKEKPQRDLRRTVRVPRRPANKGESAPPATSPQPPADTSATSARPSGRIVGTEDAPRLLAPPRVSTPLDASRLASAEPPLSGEPHELRSGTTPPASLAPTPEEQREQNEERAFAIVAGARGIWQSALGVIRQQMTIGAFVTWFTGTRLEQRGDTYFVVAPNAYALDWLRDRYAPVVRTAIGASVDEITPDVRVVLEAELADVAP